MKTAAIRANSNKHYLLGQMGNPNKIKTDYCLDFADSFENRRNLNKKSDFLLF
jgi:hypothetical protein